MNYIDLCAVQLEAERAKVAKLRDKVRVALEFLDAGLSDAAFEWLETALAETEEKQ